ncbi:MAG: hypothetical protein K6F68_05025 [Clostridiales bacterium]|nr:hypothetical protein [Clostridiales bacterium]
MNRLRLTALVLLIALLFSGNGCKTSYKQPVTTPAPTEAIALPDGVTFGEHSREPGYSVYFKTCVYDSELVTVAVDLDIYSEEALFSLAGAISRDVAAAAERLGAGSAHPTIYIVDKVITGQPLAVENHVFCTAPDVESGEYRAALMGAYYGIPIPWKQYGLFSYVFGEPDDIGLQFYYMNSGNTLTSSCAALFLSPLSADAKTVEMGRKTAASITAFVMERGGLDALRAIKSTQEVLPEWQETIGVKMPLTLPDDDAEAACMTVERDPNGLYAVRIGSTLICVKKDGFISLPDELYTFILYYLRGVKLVFTVIRRDAPEFSELAETRFNDRITINIQSNNSSFMSGNTIRLTDEFDIWHELVHVLLEPDRETRSFSWLCEAIAQHFSLYAESIVSGEYERSCFSDYASWARWYARENGISGQAAEQHIKFFRGIYDLLRASDEETPEGIVNFHLFDRAYGISSLLLPDDPFFDRTSVGEVNSVVFRPKHVDGNGLTYEEALAMFDYLMDAYGADKVMQGYMNARPLTETFGKDYEELYADFMKYLNDTYGEFLK